MTLALFFTHGVSLKIWVNQGLFDREKLIYEEHLKQSNLNKVYWLTYGSNDKVLANKLKQENRLHKDIKILQMPKIFNIPKIGSYLYSLFSPFIHKKELKKSHILKTNQMDGSWSAIIAKWLYKKLLIVRTGYTLSIFTKRQKVSKLKQYFIETVEQFAYKNSDINIVASNQDKKYILNKYYIKNNIQVFYNYIDINKFKNLNLQRYENRMLFVGRLNEQKNLFNLIEAISKINLTLDIYGKGELREKLEQFTKNKNAKVNFKGLIVNSELPKIYNSYKFYILPSYFEGMPKTLLEAMACGCICIGTDVNGINEVIEDGVNGYLSNNIDMNSLITTINKVMKLNNINIINNGILNIQRQYSLNSITSLEKDIFGVLNV